MKVVRIALLVFVSSLGLWAQNPATDLPKFQLSAKVMSLPGGGVTSVATDIGATFAVTNNWLLRSDNILAPAVNLQGFFGGIQGPIPYAGKYLAKTNLDPKHFQPYITASLGAAHIVKASADSQQFAVLAGGGANYDPSGSGKFTINLFEARWAKLPGFANSTVIVSSGINLGW
jgi:hypothetical protein